MRKPVLGLLCLMVGAGWTTVRGADEVRLLKGPYLQAMTSTSAVVMWETNVASNSAVELTTGGGTKSTLVGPANVTVHEVLLTGLSAATPYTYRVAIGASHTEAARFRTAPGRNAPSTFAVFGDNRSQPEVFAKIAAGIHARKPDFLLHTGDLVADGTKYEQWGAMFFGPAQALLATAPIFPSRGNHERNSELFGKFFSLPGNERWYSFDWANAHFAALDSCGDQSIWERDSEQTRWLDCDLAASKAKWKFVYFHHPLYSSGNHGSSQPHRAAWEELFSKHLVDVVFQGHDHTYERTYRVFNGKRDELLGVTYVVAGGGGAPLYDVTANDWTAFSRKTHSFTLAKLEPDRLRLETYDLDGRLIDHLAISKDPAELPRLLEQVQQVATNSRLEAVRGLSELATSAVLFYAPALAGHPDSALRRALAEALNRAGAPEGVPHALLLLRNADPIIKREVAALLGKVADEKTAEKALPLLAEPDAQTRIGAARALSRGKLSKARPALMKSLADEDPLVRYWSAFAFARLATKDDLSILAARLKQDEHALPRTAIVTALGDSGLRAAVPILLDALGDSSAKVKAAALISLRSLTQQDFGLDATRWRQWWETTGGK